MSMKIKFTNDTDLLLNNHNENFLLIENLKDNDLYEDIIYPYNLSINDVDIIQNYINGEKYLNKVDNIIDVIKFLLYIGDLNIDNFIKSLEDYDKIKNNPNIIYLIQDYIQVCYCSIISVLPDNLDISIGGIYLSLQQQLKMFEFKPQFIKLSDPGDIISFPKIKVSNRYNFLNHGLISLSKNSFNIWNGQIDWNKSFWLKDFPWKKYNVGVAGGFIVSSLQGILEDDQDIDLYILDPHEKYDIVKYFINKFSCMAKLFYEELKDPKSLPILTLVVPGQRPLQLIIPFFEKMSDVVRTFDFSHLRIWYNKDGLIVELASIYELCRGYTNLIRTGINTIERIGKYTKRGWTILGNSKIVDMENNIYIKSKHKLVVPSIAIDYFVDTSIPLLGYVPNEGINIGHIEKLCCDDLNLVKIFSHDITFLKLFTPVIFYITLENATFFKYQEHGAIHSTVYITISNDSKNKINKLLKHLYKLAQNNTRNEWRDFTWCNASDWKLRLSEKCLQKVSENQSISINNIIAKIQLYKMWIGKHRVGFDMLPQLMMDFVEI